MVYKLGIEPIPYTGEDTSAGELGTFTRGIQRLSGLVFSYHGSVAEALFAITDPVDLLIRYRANGQKRLRTLINVIFIGDAMVTMPDQNNGISELIGVPFRVQIPNTETLANHITDAVDS